MLHRVIERYEGTRLGRQELDAEWLEDMRGALWRRDEIDASRRAEAPELRRVVVAIDPAATSVQFTVTVNDWSDKSALRQSATG